MNGRVTRIGLDEAGKSGLSDWDRVISLTDDDIDAAVADDSDSYPLSNTELADANDRGAAYQIYADEHGKWRWRLVGPTNGVVAASEAAFDSREAVVSAIGEFRSAVVGATLKAA